MPDLVQLLVMFLAFLAYLIISGGVAHWRRQRRAHQSPKEWWGQR